MKRRLLTSIESTMGRSSGVADRRVARKLHRRKCRALDVGRGLRRDRVGWRCAVGCWLWSGEVPTTGEECQQYGGLHPTPVTRPPSSRGLSRWSACGCGVSGLRRAFDGRQRVEACAGVVQLSADPVQGLDRPRTLDEVHQPRRDGAPRIGVDLHHDVGAAVHRREDAATVDQVGSDTDRVGRSRVSTDFMCSVTAPVPASRVTCPRYT